MSQINSGENADQSPCVAAGQSVAGDISANPASTSTSTRPSVSASFSGLSTEERFLLFAIQQAGDGLEEFHLSFLTNLETAPTKEALATLKNLKLIEQLSDEAVPRFYQVTFSSAPLFPSWQSWLAGFCAEEPPECEGDTLGTTFGTVEAVILLALLSGSRDAKVITPLTLLPQLFVDYVLELIGVVEKWCSVELHQLERLLIEARDNHSEIRGCLHSVMELLWDLWWSPEGEVQLNRLRARH
jgi:hypothetical protein